MFSRHQATRIELNQDDVIEFDRTMQEVEDEITRQQEQNLSDDHLVPSNNQREANIDARIGYSEQQRKMF